MIGVLISVLAAGVVVFLFGRAGGSGDSTTVVTPPERTRTRIAYTVENDASSGVWGLDSPVMEEFTDHADRPLNARRWIPNGVAVIVECATEGTAYEVELNGHFQRWHWYARLKDGSWFPLAGFAEATTDGSQGLVPC